jgi:phosphocarrier protein
MIEKEIKIFNKLGMHARAAAKFVHLASRFKCSVHLLKDGQKVNGKSILGILMLAAAQGSVVQLSVEGLDEKEAFIELEELIMNRFGEKE